VANTFVLSSLPVKDSWEQKGGTINDASCLDRTNIYGIVRVTKIEDISRALAFARAHHIKISLAGVRHSMGGQAFAHNALVLDMREFKSVDLDTKNKTMTVQSGATWHDIQNTIHPRFAIKAMQSTDIFSIGGSISVNAHGMDHQAGSVGDTIRSMRVMLADGSIVTASRTENADLFRHVVGGYGLFGVVLDATIELADNVIYRSARQVVPTSEFPNAWATIEKNKDVGLFYAHLSTAPHNYLKEAILYTYTKTDADPLTSPALGEVPSIGLRRLTINFSKLGVIPMELKWFSEKYIEPMIETCEISRNAAQSSGEGCLVSRNEPMHDSVAYLKNNLKNDTDILHEYFIPRDQLLSFVDGMREIFKNDRVNLLNASVRVVHKEDIALNYAPQDMFSVVLYINQTTDAEGSEKMKKATQELIDLTVAHKGRFFLPYQLYYTPAQLEASYPMIKEFFASKKAYDPEDLLTNTWYNTYAPKILKS
jgi:FAD/FMN-containing dehydrogenase